MMKSIVDENLVSFKVLEQKIFDYVKKKKTEKNCWILFWYMQTKWKQQTQ